MIAELREIDSKVAVWLCVLAGLTVFVIIYLIVHPIMLIGGDIQAFWCGGAALLAHANPYLNEPLRACEATHSPAVFYRYSDATIPAPLPPYALALFAPLALIPFPLARALWWIALGIATIAVGRGISAITGLPPVSAFAASAFAVAAPAIIPGALSPVPIALTVCAALALMRKQWNAAALLLGVAMIEPHMALPACAAVFLFIPQMRVRLAIAGACAVLLSLGAVGLHGTIAYFTTVLPAHAASEINMLGQDSLTALLYHIGVSSQVALRFGSLQYALLSAGGIYLANRLYRQLGDPVWLVLLPSAFAVIGGPFIHLSEVAMALPLACLIAVRRPTIAAQLVLLLLAIAAESFINWVLLAPAAALVCGWLLARYPQPGPLRFCARLPLIALVGVAFIVIPLVVQFAILLPHAIPSTALPDAGPKALASVSWSELNARSVLLGVWWPEKVLTLVPLAALVWLACMEAFPARLGAAVRRRVQTA